MVSDKGIYFTTNLFAHFSWEDSIRSENTQLKDETKPRKN